MPTGKEQAQAERLAQNEANQEAQDEWAEASATERLPEAKDVDEPKVVGTPKSDKKRSGTTGAKSLGKK
jgi:hypothetical protein